MQIQINFLVYLIYSNDRIYKGYYETPLAFPRTSTYILLLGGIHTRIYFENVTIIICICIFVCLEWTRMYRCQLALYT